MTANSRPIGLRIPEDLYRALKVRAAYSGKTLNGYLIDVFNEVIHNPPDIGRNYSGESR